MRIVDSSESTRSMWDNSSCEVEAGRGSRGAAKGDRHRGLLQVARVQDTACQGKTSIKADIKASIKARQAMQVK
jgi:hypothetical protein